MNNMNGAQQTLVLLVAMVLLALLLGAGLVCYVAMRVGRNEAIAKAALEMREQKDRQ